MWLAGHSNEAMVVVKRVETMVLLDIRTQVSTLMEGFCLKFRLTIFPLMGLLHLEGTRGISIPYKGYIEANLIIQGLPQV